MARSKKGTVSLGPDGKPRWVQLAIDVPSQPDLPQPERWVMPEAFLPLKIPARCVVRDWGRDCGTPAVGVYQDSAGKRTVMCKYHYDRRRHSR